MTDLVAAPLPTPFLSDLRFEGDYQKVHARLLAAQKLLGPASRTAENTRTHSRYPTLATVIDSIKASLHAQDLVVLQSGTSTKEGVTVTTYLLAPEGALNATLTLPTRDPSPHGAASVLTFARRYALQTLLLQAAADEDDDGNAGMGTQPPPLTPALTPAPMDPEVLTALTEARAAAGALPGSPEERPDHLPQGHTDEGLAPPPAAASLPEGQPPSSSTATTGEPPELNNLPAEEAAQIRRLKAAVQSGSCSLQKATLSLSPGGVSHSRLSLAGQALARRYILDTQ